jgi:hypothetical protein
MFNYNHIWARPFRVKKRSPVTQKTSGVAFVLPIPTNNDVAHHSAIPNKQHSGKIRCNGGTHTQGNQKTRRSTLSDVARNDWNSSEASWDFLQNPLVAIPKVP